MLDGYRGIVQCDGYRAYKTIADKAPGEAITLAFCWAQMQNRPAEPYTDGVRRFRRYRS